MADRTSDRMDRDGATRLPSLMGADDFINWRRHVETYLQQNDLYLNGLSDRSDPASLSQQRRWLELNAEAKSTVTTTVCNGPFA